MNTLVRPSTCSPLRANLAQGRQMQKPPGRLPRRLACALLVRGSRSRYQRGRGWCNGKAEARSSGLLRVLRPERSNSPQIPFRIAHVESGGALREHRRSTVVQRPHDIGAGSDRLLVAQLNASLSIAASAIDAMPAADDGLLAGGRGETKTKAVRHTSSAKRRFPFGSRYTPAG